MEPLLAHLPQQQHFELERDHRFRHVSSIYRSSPDRSTLRTSGIKGLGMRQAFTEAVGLFRKAISTRTVSRLERVKNLQSMLWH